MAPRVKTFENEHMYHVKSYLTSQNGNAKEWKFQKSEVFVEDVGHGLELLTEFADIWNRSPHACNLQVRKIVFKASEGK